MNIKGWRWRIGKLRSHRGYNDFACSTKEQRNVVNTISHCELKINQQVKIMGRELWLLRHGKSQRDVDMADFDRPLKKRGKQAAQRVGAWMKQHDHIPDIVISSPAKRACDTAQRVCAAIGVSERDVQLEQRLYFQGINEIKTVLAECTAHYRRVLLVGHNPDFEELLIHLVGLGNVPDVDKLLPTAALARLAMPDDWSRLDAGCAQLLSMTYEKALPG
ncbi:MAG: histidine phosphatase family protein [Methylovulum sp.]|nr:histidine phosphatase family protein [Methylovulum sp.]